MAREMKDSGIEWIGEIPAEWKLIRTKHCYSNHKDIAGEKADDYERLALTLKGVIKRPKDDSVGLQPEAFNSYQILRENELVFKLIDLANVATSRVGYSPYLGIVSPAYIVLHPNQTHESKYGEYYFLSMWQREIFNHMGDDGVRSSLNASDLLNAPYLYAPSDEKRRIVDFLDNECSSIDSVIDQTRASIEEYKKLKQAVITQAVTKGIRPDRQMKDSGVEWIESIPADWQMIRGKGLFFETNERSEDGSEELLTVSQYTGVTPRSQKNVNMFEAESLEGYKICEIGDIAANTMWLWAGAIGVSEYRGVISPSYNIYRQKEGLYNRQYLDYLLRIYPLVQHYESLSTGIRASRLRLYPQQFLNIMFPVPSMEEQCEIVDYLSVKTKALDALIASKEQIVSSLDSYKKSLIYEYVTGKKEVPA